MKSDSPRYLVAKYIPDLQRMEPRNIGVIVWSGAGIFARFAAERPGKPTEIDGRTIPAFVASTAAYKQWVQFWRHLIVQAASKRFADDWASALKGTSKGNFCLTEGGAILQDMSARELPELTDYLYSVLVDAAFGDESRDPALDDIADHVIRELRLTESKHFYSRFEVACSIAPNVTERFEFSHAIRNGALKRLYQRVPLARRRTLLRRTVHDSAWMFEKVVLGGFISREQAVSLVYATDQQRSDPEVNWSLDVLSSVSRVANLANPREALQAFIVE